MTTNSASNGLLSLLRMLAAIAVAALFLYAAQAKIIDPAQFSADLRNYRVLPWWSLNAIALVFPWWEVTAGIALLFPRWRKAGALITLLMSIVFFIMVTQALIRGLNISCGCFGHGQKAGLQTLAIDAAMLLLSIFVLRESAHPREAPAAAPLAETTAARA